MLLVRMENFHGKVIIYLCGFIFLSSILKTQSIHQHPLFMTWTWIMIILAVFCKPSKCDHVGWKLAFNLANHWIWYSALNRQMWMPFEGSFFTRFWQILISYFLWSNLKPSRNYFHGQWWDLFCLHWLLLCCILLETNFASEYQSFDMFYSSQFESLVVHH